MSLLLPAIAAGFMRTTPSSGYADAVLADSPTVYYRLSEVPVVVDSGSNGAAWVPGASAVFQVSPLVSDGGHSAQSGGSGAIASLGSVPASLAGGSVTMECWVDLAGSSSGVFMNLGTDANGWAMGIGNTNFDNSGLNLILVTNGIAWNSTGVTLTTGTHHLVAARDSGNGVTIYVDGSSVATVALSSPGSADTISAVGGSSSRSLTSGIRIDNAAFYASTLSSTQVDNHYNSGSGDDTAVAADSPVVWLKLDDDPATGFADSSGNSHTMHPNGSGETYAQAGPLVDGYAIDFSTASGYLATSDTFTQPTTATYECWVKLAESPSSQTAVLGFAGGASGIGPTAMLTVNTFGELEFDMYSGGDASLTAPSALTTGVWHHVVCSVGAAGAKIRVDKTTVASSATTAVSSFVTGPFLVRGGGGYGPGGTGAITIAEPAAWDTQLSDAQTDAHYDAA